MRNKYYNLKALPNQCISYDEAVLLYQNGFNQEANDIFITMEFNNDIRTIVINKLDWNYANNRDPHNNPWTICPDIEAPTYGQVFKWFRDVHNLLIHINYSCYQYIESYKFNVYKNKPREDGFTEILECNQTEYKTYEEAESGCLKFLISKITKNPVDIKSEIYSILDGDLQGDWSFSCDIKDNLPKTQMCLCMGHCTEMKKLVNQIINLKK